MTDRTVTAARSADHGGEQLPATRHPGVVLAVIVTCQLMLMLDSTVMNVALPRVRAELHFSATGLSWVMSAYTLVYGGLLLLGGRAGDILGRRRVFVGGIALFTIASLAGGLAGSAPMLIIARIAQGIGAAAAGPSALALITTTFTEPRARVRAFSVYTGVGSSGIALGLVVGGLLTQLASWRMVLFINVPVGIAVAALALRFVVDPVRHRVGFDLSGAMVGTAGMAAVVYGLTSAAGAGWTHPLTIGALAAGVALLVAFVRLESRAATPLLPLRLFVDRNRAAAYGNFFLGATALLATFFFLTQFSQNLAHHTPLRTGIEFLPMALTMIVMTRLIPVLLRRFGARPLVLVGAVAMVAGLLWLTRLTPASDYTVGLLGPLVLVGVGVGLGLAPLNVVIMATVPPADAGAAGGVLQTMQQVGSTFGLAMFVAVFGAANRSALASGANVEHAQVTGMSTAFLAAAVVAVGAVVVAATLRDRPRRDRDQPATR